MKYPIYTQIHFLLTMTASTFSALGQTCAALVEGNGKLYATTSDGKILNQFPTNARDKSNISLSPDFKKVSFQSTTEPQYLSIINAAGVSSKIYIAGNMYSNLFESTWDSEDLLQIRHRYGHIQDKFSFIYVDEAPSLHIKPSHIRTDSAACQAHGRPVSIACITEGVVEINSERIYTPNKFAQGKSRTLAVHKIHVGTGIYTQTAPSFHIELISIKDGITLKLSSPTGYSSTSRINEGEVFDIPLGDDIYGVTAKVLDSRTGIVEAKLLKSGYNSTIAETAIAWKGKGKVVIFERLHSGDSLVIINTTYPHQHTKFPASLPMSISYMKFISPSKIFFKGSPDEFTLGTINLNNSNGNVIESIEVLPRLLAVKSEDEPLPLPVLDWVCGVQAKDRP
ncbi:hypothetical protein LZ017_05045 [Pelomonas sp. CA6]|uniref:hypothetical protein n=1 Tax=Pelomonas sp. CA6 TaxID=2907999 RepID=UPI001F4B865E|nr:hypothetical protein [Pelomonas sp. CA6]MCH7342744.1 hypothetical protein [Pelomonas sp. CA6]